MKKLSVQMVIAVVLGTIAGLFVAAVPGGVADQVMEEAAAWRADLIVIGTHGRRGVRRLILGSDAEQVLRSAHIPVLLVRGE